MADEPLVGLSESPPPVEVGDRTAEGGARPAGRRRGRLVGVPADRPESPLLEGLEGPRSAPLVKTGEANLPILLTIMFISNINAIFKKVHPLVTF